MSCKFTVPVVVMLIPPPFPATSILDIVISEIEIPVAEPLIVIKRCPAPSNIALPSKKVRSFPAPIMDILEPVRFILSSVIPVPQVPSPTLI